MNTDQFWQIIEKAKKSADGDAEAFCESVSGQLVKLPAPEIVGFAAEFRRKLHEAYTWELWGAAYIICGGCGDDMFEYWRAGLIAQGRKVFEATLKDPDSLATLSDDSPIMSEDVMDYESALYVASSAYEEKTGGEELPDEAYPQGPADPKGNRWDEDGDDLEKMLPKLWERFVGEEDEDEDDDEDEE